MNSKLINGFQIFNIILKTCKNSIQTTEFTFPLMAKPKSGFKQFASI